MLAARRRRKDRIAKTDFRQGKRIPIEKLVKLVGDGDPLGRARGGWLVFKINPVRKWFVRRDKPLCPKTTGTKLIIRIDEVRLGRVDDHACPFGDADDALERRTVEGRADRRPLIGIRRRRRWPG